MPLLDALAEHVVRTAHLLALTVAPSALSPEPATGEGSRFDGLLATLALGALLYGATRLAAHADTRRARIAASLVWVAVAAALVATIFVTGPGAPLGRAVTWIAIPVWGALAAVASAAGDRWLGSSFKHRQMAPIVIVLCIGALQIGNASKLLGSTDAMWWAALRRDPDHPRAIEALTAPPRKAKKWDDLRKVAERCLKLDPTSCICLETKADAMMRGRAEGAVGAARLSSERCPEGMGRAQIAEALSAAGQGAAAEAEARAGIAAVASATGAPRGLEARLHYALALALEKQARLPEATAEAERAVELAAGRDAELLLGALRIVAGDLDGAQRILEPLAAADPSDERARYDLALIADKRGDYNGAREGYLGALKADPNYADARYNLALLTFRYGAVDEARHHVKKLAEAAPNDARLADLARTTGAELR